MKRLLTALLAVLLLSAALPAAAQPVRLEDWTFNLYTDKSNQVVHIAGLDTSCSGIQMSVENENGTQILSKNKPYTVVEDNTLWLCTVVTPKKVGKCAYDFVYGYADKNNNWWEYVHRVTLNFSEPPGPPEITKDPTGETVAEEGSCVFIAKADKADSVTWFLTNGYDTVKASKASNRFRGLKVTGADGEKLKLMNVPASLDGWEAFATFTNTYGSTDSESAEIFVYTPLTKQTEVPYYAYVTPTPAPVTPTPAPAQPSVSLSAGPQDPFTGYCELTANLYGCPSYVYQWYYNTRNVTYGAIPVGGSGTTYGNTVSLTASFEGKTEPYYYWFIKAWNPQGGMPVYSKSVQLMNPFAPENVVTPAPTFTPAPRITATPAPTAAPAPDRGEGPAPTPYNGTKLCAGSIAIKNAAGREVGLSEQEAKKVTGFLGGTYVLIDEPGTRLWYTNAYGSYAAGISPLPVKATLKDGSDAGGATVLDEVTKVYPLTWEELPKVLTDHAVTASAVEITEQYGFVTAVRLTFGLDGREQFRPFDEADHSNGWRYSVNELFDVPIA